MKGRKIAALLLAAVMLLGCLSGCGKKESSGLAEKHEEQLQQKDGQATPDSLYAFSANAYAMPETVRWLRCMSASGDTAYVTADVSGGTTMQKCTFVNADGETVEKEVSVPCLKSCVLEVDLKSGAVREAGQFALPAPAMMDGNTSAALP